ncbi:hypothetical protein [Pedobacter heparinus]|uniref:hypothetical protein n=1 Tax=Pedobacter heparinus TaxID=984 RepID=UPI00292D73ED|nr:hypothetical protein [Pedobacter heparinus]
MKKTIYITFNLAYQLIVFFCLLYANTYINDNVVPESLLWQNNQPRVDTAGMLGFAAIKTLVLIVEGGILVLLVYFINRSVMNNGTIIKRTLKVNVIVTMCFIIVLIWGSFNGYLW